MITSRDSEATGAEELLDDLRNSKTDLATLVAAVIRDRPPYVVVPVKAVTAWERREPEHWARVAEWLAARSVSIVKV